VHALVRGVLSALAHPPLMLAVYPISAGPCNVLVALVEF